MSKTIVLVGHCGFDGPRLQEEVSGDVRSARVVACNDADELEQICQEGADLLLVNRELQYGFDEDQGVDLIRRLKDEYPDVKMMLVSDRPEAQEEAVEAGALPGFGKSELDSPRLAELLKKTLA